MTDAAAQPTTSAVAMTACTLDTLPCSISENHSHAPLVDRQIIPACGACVEALTELMEHIGAKQAGWSQRTQT